MIMTKMRDVKQVNQNDLMLRLSVLYKSFDKNGDLENKDKVIELVKKLKDNEFIIGFCGHFSAGKSSMMNELMNEEVLPSSPIPTSANVVKVKKGRSYARVFYKEGEPIEFPAPYDYDVVKSYCKDGNFITSIEISQEDINLPEGIAIMDTPGIDSTDDAHRISTESMLHLADMILYVMDYNHVQSEQNFQFTKTLKERNKPVYLVVNQIDKHDESELNFESFKEGVDQSFKDWGVNVDGIFYTSLFKRDHKHNQYKKLEQFLTTQMENKDELLKQSVINSAEQLIKDHKYFLKKKQEQKRASLTETLSNLSENEKEAIFTEINSLEERLADVNQEVTNFEDEFEKGLQHILDNAYMMPATTRELAHDFIESCQSDFKVGLLFSKKKTEQERLSRLEKFYSDLKKQVEANVDWHIKDFIVKFFKNNGIQEENLLKDVYDLKVEVSTELIRNTVKTGAGLTGNYVLNYTNDLANEVKRLYRNAARKKVDEAEVILSQKVEAEKKEIENKLSNFTHLQEAYVGLQKLDEELNTQSEKQQLILIGKMDDESLEEAEDWLENQLNKEEKVKKQVMELTKKTKVNQDHEKLETHNKNNREKLQPKQFVEEPTNHNLDDLTKETVTSLIKANGLLQDIKGLKTIANDMKAKAERLENRSFTVALFGAFSAGKSSFANALMGMNVLPVSPNPTTATINKIVPPNQANPHGTVKVMLKKEEDLARDLSHSLQVFGKSCKTVSEALQIIDTINYDGENIKEKPHYAFLKAVQVGFVAVKDSIGQELNVDLDTFRDYVAKEEKACFVEWIELYYDCPLTRQGITLVDTPGADSINARHTGVAFEYIKNADAILFVTYYNHAFSKADREFLIQLGRVKETFEMDKMFFIVNAADLAKSKEELNFVVDYVDEQLLSYGIRETRIYPISSKLALKAKQAQNNEAIIESGIEKFENDFKTYIVGELTEVAISAANEEMKHALKTLNELRYNAKQSDEEKKQKLDEVKNHRGKILQEISKLDISSEKRAIIQEVDELLYYVKQRVFLRFNDLFTESFNPSSLRDDGRDMKKALHNCLDELIQFIGFDLSQEMRATALRIEKYLNKTLQSVHVKTVRNAHDQNENIHLLAYESKAFKTLDFENGLKNIDKTRFKTALSLFKNAKAFFEQGVKLKMRDEIQNKIETPVDHYLLQQNERIKEAYLREFESYVLALKENIQDEINEYYEGIITVLGEKVDLSKINDAVKEIQTFVK